MLGAKQVLSAAYAAVPGSAVLSGYALASAAHCACQHNTVAAIERSCGWGHWEAGSEGLRGGDTAPVRSASELSFEAADSATSKTARTAKKKGGV